MFVCLSLSCLNHIYVLVSTFHYTKQYMYLCTIQNLYMHAWMHYPNWGRNDLGRNDLAWGNVLGGMVLETKWLGYRGAKWPKVKTEAKRLGGKALGENILWVKWLVTPLFTCPINDSAQPFLKLSTINPSHAAIKSKKISNDQELIQSDPISCRQNQKGNN